MEGNGSVSRHSVGLVAGVNRVVSMTSICKFAASDRKISVEPSWDIVDTLGGAMVT